MSRFINFLYILLKDFNQKEGFERASALSYAILVSFIPFFISLASIVTFFLPSKTYYRLEKVILDNSLPVIGEQIASYMAMFHNHALQLSVMSIIFLFITSILMLNSLNTHLSKLWNVDTSIIKIKVLAKNFIIMAFVSFILGIVSICLSYISLYFYKDYVFVLRLFSVFLTILAFTLTYRFIPMRKNNFKEAFLTGVLAGLLFEVAKYMFAIYIKYFASQNILYGTLATIPIFLLWIYIGCNILLFCANINVVRQTRK